jgi:branched-chain amino acid transport system permease protein
MSRLPWWLRDLILLALFVALLLAASYAVDALHKPYIAHIIALMGVNITLAVSLNIINGHAGQFSLGHAGFESVGGYCAAFLTFYYFAPLLDRLPESRQFLAQHALFLVALLAGGTLAAIAGYLVGIPSLRLRGDYLAIVTLGFGEIIRVLILNIQKIGGARGFSGVPHWSNFFWVWFFAGLTIFISSRLVKSSVGRAFLAVREDEIAAEAMGVDVTRYKVKAFVIGSFLAGVAGGLLAHHIMYLKPDMFGFVASFEIVMMVVLGGLGSISGSILTAIVLTYLPEGLRYVKDYIPGGKDPRMVIYSLLLIVLMLTRPQGILGRRELWDVLARRKDVVPKDTRDEAGDKTDRSAAPPVT